MDILKSISLDVRQLISINEKIQSAVLRGTPLNHDETEIVQRCATELLHLAHRTVHTREKGEKVANPSRSAEHLQSTMTAD